MDNYTFKALMECDDFCDIMYMEVVNEASFQADKIMRTTHSIMKKTKEAKKIEESDPNRAKKLYNEVLKELSTLRKEAEDLPDDNVGDKILRTLNSFGITYRIFLGQDAYEKNKKGLNRAMAVTNIDMCIKKVKDLISRL